MSRDIVEDLSRRVVAGHAVTTSSWRVARDIAMVVRAGYGRTVDIEHRTVPGRGPVYTVTVAGRG